MPPPKVLLKARRRSTRAPARPAGPPPRPRPRRSRGGGGASPRRFARSAGAAPRAALARVVVVRRALRARRARGIGASAKVGPRASALRGGRVPLPPSSATPSPRVHAAPRLKRFFFLRVPFFGIVLLRLCHSAGCSAGIAVSLVSHAADCSHCAQSCPRLNFR